MCILKAGSKNLAALWLNNSCLSPQYPFPGSVVLPVSPDIAWPEACDLLPTPFSSHRAKSGRGPSSGVLGAASLGSPWAGFQSTRKNDAAGFGVHWSRLFLLDLLFLLLCAQCPSCQPPGLQSSGAFFTSLCPGFLLQGAKYFEFYLTTQFTSAPFICHCPSPTSQPLTGPLALTGPSPHCTTSYPAKQSSGVVSSPHSETTTGLPLSPE